MEKKRWMFGNVSSQNRNIDEGCGVESEIGPPYSRNRIKLLTEKSAASCREDQPEQDY